MSKDWYCQIDGQEVGPMEASKLKSLATAGTLKMEDLVRRNSVGVVCFLRDQFSHAVKGHPFNWSEIINPFPKIAQSSHRDRVFQYANPMRRHR